MEVEMELMEEEEKKEQNDCIKCGKCLTQERN